MRERITIQGPDTPGTLGQPRWKDLLTVRAQLEPVTGRELNSPQLTGSETTHKFTIRVSPEAAVVKAESMRIVLGARLFVITHVIKPFGNRLIDLFCREVMPA